MTTELLKTWYSLGAILFSISRQWRTLQLRRRRYNQGVYKTKGLARRRPRLLPGLFWKPSLYLTLCSLYWDGPIRLTPPLAPRLSRFEDASAILVEDLCNGSIRAQTGFSNKFCKRFSERKCNLAGHVHRHTHRHIFLYKTCLNQKPTSHQKWGD